MLEDEQVALRFHVEVIVFTGHTDDTLEPLAKQGIEADRLGRFASMIELQLACQPYPATAELSLAQIDAAIY